MVRLSHWSALQWWENKEQFSGWEIRNRMVPFGMDRRSSHGDTKSHNVFRECYGWNCVPKFIC